MKSIRLIPLFCLSLLPCVSHAQQQRDERPETVIESDSLRMDGGDELNVFTFAGGVRAKSEDLVLTCEKLVITAGRQASADAAVGELGAVKSVVATGDVAINQAGRVAYAGRAEVEPEEGLVTLSESPKIVDSNATVEGWKIVYNSKTKNVQVLPDPSAQNGKRSRVILSEQAIPKLDYQNIQRPDIPPLQGEKSETPEATDQPQDDNGE